MKTQSVLLPVLTAILAVQGGSSRSRSVDGGPSRRGGVVGEPDLFPQNLLSLNAADKSDQGVRQLQDYRSLRCLNALTAETSLCKSADKVGTLSAWLDCDYAKLNTATDCPGSYSDACERQLNHTITFCAQASTNSTQHPYEVTDQCVETSREISEICSGSNMTHSEMVNSDQDASDTESIDAVVASVFILISVSALIFGVMKRREANELRYVEEPQRPPATINIFSEPYLSDAVEIWYERGCQPEEGLSIDEARKVRLINKLESLREKNQNPLREILGHLSKQYRNTAVGGIEEPQRSCFSHKVFCFMEVFAEDRKIRQLAKGALTSMDRLVRDNRSDQLPGAVERLLFLVDYKNERIPISNIAVDLDEICPFTQCGVLVDEDGDRIIDPVHIPRFDRDGKPTVDFDQSDERNSVDLTSVSTDIESSDILGPAICGLHELLKYYIKHGIDPTNRQPFSPSQIRRITPEAIEAAVEMRVRRQEQASSEKVQVG